MTNNANIFTFDYLIWGIIPSSLMALLMSVTSRKEATDITNNIGHIAQSLFKDRIWNYRCNIFTEWEQTKGITTDMKHTPPAQSAHWRDSDIITNSSQAPVILRWKS